MNHKCLFAFELVFVFWVLNGTASADVLSCVNAEVHGADVSTSEILRQRLIDDLGVPLREDNSPTCARLRIDIDGVAVKIVLDSDDSIETLLHLEDVVPEHRPRAISLSAAGLIALKRNKTTAEAPSSNRDPPAGDATHTPAQEVTEDNDTTAFAPAKQPRSNPRRALLWGLFAGVKGVVKYPTWVLDAGVALRLVVRRFEPEMAIVGFWGQKSASLGTIHLTGVGLRLALTWRLVDHRGFNLCLGPGAALFGAWGIGRQSSGSDHSIREFTPVLDVLLQVDGRLALSKRLALRVRAGGGYTPVYLAARADQKEVTGLSGGFVTLSVGLDFDLW